MRNDVLEWLRRTAVVAVLGAVDCGAIHAAETAVAEPPRACAAATPVPNPWTKKCPPGWWLKRHEAFPAAICERVRHKAPQADILLLAIFPKAFGANRHDVANGLIAKLADGERMRFLDLNEALVAGKGIADRVGHLNEQGFAIWAEQIRPVVAKMLEEPSAARRP